MELGKKSPFVVNDLAEAKKKHLDFVNVQGEEFVNVQFQRQPALSAEPEQFACWRRLGHSPLKDLVPSTVWFLLKLGLFAVGAVVLWKRPSDNSAAQFFVLCVATVGAYMGGYHWSRIATQPALLLVFMLCAVLLPAVSLHFYLIFPRPKAFVRAHRLGVFCLIYGVPVAFLMWMVVSYLNLRGLVRSGAADAEIESALAQGLLTAAAYYLRVAAVWYLGCVVGLLHSYWTAVNATERNQVKCILYGSLLALVPMGYTLYLIFWNRQAFFNGQATWPMFLASVCFTCAFAISITRYRLMQLDQIVSSGAVYILISVLVGLVYYGVVFAGTLGATLAGTQDKAKTSLAPLWVSTTTLILLLLLNFGRSRFIKAVDRRFYREKHQLDRTLKRMGEAIQQLVDPPTLARRLLQASGELLSVPRGAVYLLGGDPPLYQLAGCLGPVSPPLAELSIGCPLVEALLFRKSVIAWPERPDDPAQRQLRFLGGEVAVALAHEGQLLAFLVLGPRQLGAYRAEDLNLLAAFAQLSALALESARGNRTIDILNRDLRAMVAKTSEQQRRILALQSQLTKAPEAAGPEEATNRGTVDEADVGRGTAMRRANGSDAFRRFIGSSPRLRGLIDMARKVAATPSAVLIRGESGTGKELLARALHDASSRHGKPYVKVHCAALSAGLLESELFGHVKGSFTGAHRDKVGRFELANGGTLFLDEIGDISWEVQTKLLRVIQEMTFERVGSSEPMRVDVRLIAATHQNLEELIRNGRFREDLFYRLNVIELTIPPLRDRREDIPELALHFLEVFARRCNQSVGQIEDDAMAMLKSHLWPGNIRELENVIERAVVIAEGASVSARELSGYLGRGTDERAALAGPWRDPAVEKTASPGDGLRAEREERGRRERERLVRALAAANGNKAEAARVLGLARSTLLSRLKKYGLS
jgi:transcriptional regulator with GAF, ATPase, and Fis domain